MPGDSVLVVPIIDNKATEPELVPELLRVLQKYPKAPAVLVRDLWSNTWAWKKRVGISGVANKKDQMNKFLSPEKKFRVFDYI